MKKKLLCTMTLIFMLVMAACQSSEGNNGSNPTTATEASKVPKSTKAPEATPTPEPTEAPIIPIYTEEELKGMLNTSQSNEKYSYFIRWNEEWSYYVELTKCKNTTTIPAHIDGIPVKVVGSGIYPIYESDGKFYSLTVPEGVEYIADSALSGSRNLSSVKLPSTVIGIGAGAFSRTPWENSLEEEYTILGDGILYAVNLDEGATKVVIPDGVKRIYEKVFWYDTSLEQIEIPDSVISIGKYAFGAPGYGGTKWYKNLEEDFVIIGDGVLIKAPVEGATELVLPDGVKDISYGLFEEHETLERIVLPEGITVIPKKAFFSCDALTTIELPDGLKCIEEDAFADCFYLEEIGIPESVTRIDPNAFARNLWRCNNLNVIGTVGSYAETYVNNYMEEYEEAYIKGITMTFQVSE